ncbi:protein-L-isoaspartate(D-aspartate) O-methyltransferase [Yinghuangia soli]|uniref:Protein-L-isoaspartate O-methyltransferase n=1 Tax=Yinghuangia soli TaxID=2908204 RepID=A0AA41PY85_9ACTN|nr:protein-L-isoaspartate(D-aspartate) O-methyltransferase [Yinghuangia soli]MCF2528083.1 protein-L-isoaspartate(D-aspartate) O-methyltransferase [Yinghuangia soli]
MRPSGTAGAERTAELLHDELVAGGYLLPEWEGPWRAVDREHFVPERVWVPDPDGYRRLDRADDPARWRSLVHTDTALVTQVEGGASEPEFSRHPTSSASMPRMVARLMAALGTADGNTVLEIGTGVGIGAALLGERLGDDRVTSVEVDPRIGARVADVLARSGRHPHLGVGDGTAGWPERAPYDRLLSTFAVHRVPWAWVDQTRPGGRIVTPWASAFYNGVLLALDVGEDAEGKFAAGRVIGDAAFMWERGLSTEPPELPAHTASATVQRTTRLDPWQLAGDRDAAFAVGLLVPGITGHVTRPYGGGAETPLDNFTLTLTDPGSGSWAAIEHVVDAEEFTARAAGPRDIVTDVEQAVAWWTANGRPTRTRYGLTVRGDAQTAWLDTPDNSVPVITF